MENYFSSLKRALPYIKSFKDQILVFKLSGALCEPGAVLDQVVEQLDILKLLGMKIVLVHGGGQQVDSLASELGVKTERVAGRRITTPEVLELLKMSLAGSVHSNILAAFAKKNLKALGLSGIDCGMILVERREKVTVANGQAGKQLEVDYGLVGDIVKTELTPLSALLTQGVVPLICPLAVDQSGQIYNVNADTVAARIASDLGAIKLCLLTSVDGVLLRQHDPNTLLPLIDVEQAQELIVSKVVSEGMLPKINACIQAIKRGVPRVHILNGSSPDSILKELFTNEGCGTMLVERRDLA